MARNARYEPGLDLWSLSFSQLTGYLGTNQCVSERVSEFIYLGVSPRPALWPRVGHTQHHNGNQGNGINWGGGRGEKKKGKTSHVNFFSSSNSASWNSILPLSMWKYVEASANQPEATKQKMKYSFCSVFDQLYVTLSQPVLSKMVIIYI